MARIKLDEAGIRAIAKSAEMQRLIADVANKVADEVRSQGIKVGDRDGGKYEIDLPVKVSTQITDRARAVVTLAHAAGLAVQAKHGALTKAASQAGLEVKGD